jgi:hypothetical protein
MKNVRAFILIALSVVATSCASLSSSSEPNLFYGIVVTADNMPVSGYAFFVKGKKVAVTNESGFFCIERTSQKLQTVYGEKKGWACTELTLPERKEKKIGENALACVQVKSLGTLLDEVESALDRNDADEAEKLLRSAGACNDADSQVLMYKSILFYKKGDYAAAAACGKKVTTGEEENAAYSAYMKILAQKGEKE